MSRKSGRRRVLPGFRLTMGFTILYLASSCSSRLSTLPLKTATSSWETIWNTITDPRVVASYRLSVGASLVAALVNAVFGFARGVGAGALRLSRQAASSTR